MRIYEVKYQISLGGFTGDLSMLVEADFGAKAGEECRKFLEHAYRGCQGVKSDDGRFLPLIRPFYSGIIKPKPVEVDILEIKETEVV